MTAGQQPYQQPPQYQPAPPPRRANPWKWVVIGCGGLTALSVCLGIAAVVGLFGAIAGSSSPTQVVSGGAGGGQAAALPGVGQSATKGNWQVTLDNVERVQRVGNSQTAPQGIYLITYVTLKNVGKQSYPLNTTDFSVTNTATGNKYRPVSAGTAQTLNGDYPVIFLSQTVQPDLTAKTAVVFDVPPDANALTFEVQGITFQLQEPAGGVPGRAGATLAGGRVLVDGRQVLRPNRGKSIEVDERVRILGPVVAFQRTMW